MTINVYSLTGIFNPKLYIKQGQTPSQENRESEFKLTKDLDVSEEKSAFTDTAGLDQINLPSNYKVEYEINQDSHEVIIRILDSESGEVIREIPGEEFIKFRQLTEGANQRRVDETV